MEDALQTQEPIKVYENTYHMAPSEAQRFKRSKANAILAEVIQQKMEFYQVNERDKKDRLSYTFQSDEANVIIAEIVEECQKRVIAAMRSENNDQPPRYKLVFQATFGENSGQMVRCASRCLWDSDNDNCSSASWSNAKVYCVAMCFALYYE